MIDYGEILINGKCNLNCFYCLGCEMDNDVYKPYNMHFSEWKNFKEWVNSLEGTPKIYISSTNSEPLLYPYLSELIEYLQYNGFKVGIRTNASLPKMDIVSQCDEEISVSLQSLEPITFQKITGKPLTFDILDNINKIELKDSATLRVSIVVNRFNEFEIFSILNELKSIEKISYVQLRKVYKFIATDDFHDDLNAYLRISSYIKHVYQKIGNFKESEIFNVHGLHVSLWNDVFSSHSIKSSNYWTDGKMTLNNLLVPGYKDAKGD